MEIYGLGTDVSAVESVEHDEASTWNGRDVKKASDSGNIHHIVFGNMTPAQDANIIKTSGSMSLKGSQDDDGNTDVAAQVTVQADYNSCSGSARSEVHQSSDGRISGKAEAEVTVSNDNGWSVSVRGSTEADNRGSNHSKIEAEIEKKW